MGTTLAAKFKEMGQHGLIYGLGSGLYSLAAFLLIPVYTQHLSVADYGVLGLILAIGSLLTALFNFELPKSVTRSYFDYQLAMERKTVITTGLVMVAASCVVLALLGYFFSDTVAQLIFGGRYGAYVWILVLSTIVFILSRIPIVVLRIQKRSQLYITVQLMLLLTEILLVIYLVVGRKEGIKGVLLGQLWARLFVMGALFFTIRKEIVPRFSGFEARQMFRFGAPFVLVSICHFIFTFIDRYMLNYYSTLHEVGLYNLGYQLGLVVSVLLVTPLKAVWGPMFLSVKDHENFRNFCSRALTYTVFVGLMLFLVVALLAREVVMLIAEPDYWEAYRIVPLIALTYLIWGTKSILDVGAYMMRKPQVMVSYVFLGAATNMILNFFLIPSYGMTGAAYATLVSGVVMIIAVYIKNRQLFVINYEWSRIIKMGAAAILVFIGGKVLTMPNPAFSALLKVAVILAFPCLLYVLRFYTDIEMKRIKEVLV